MSRFGVAQASTGPKNYWTGGDFFDPSQWRILDRIGDTGNSEAQYYRPGNVTLSGGILQITPKVESFGGQSYTSGMLQWTGSRSCGFNGGTLSVRAKFPNARGAWPAIWLLGSDCQLTNVSTADNVGTCSWPNAGSREIDFLEVLNNDTTHLTCEIHSSAGDSGGAIAVSDVSAAFHTYDLVYTPGVSVVWKVDGSTISTLSTNIPAEPLFLIMNVAMGGIGGGAITDADLSNPATCSLQVDYVKLVRP